MPQGTSKIQSHNTSSALTPSPDSSTTALRWIVRSLAILLGVAAASIIAEFFLRTLQWPATPNVVFAGNFTLSENEILGYELLPNSPDGATRISSAGLRDREFTIDKPSNVFRIAVIGDSVTFGFRVPQTETYSRRLENLLNLAAQPGAPSFEVINFGVTGYNITQIAEQLRTRVLRYAPDLVVYGYVLNDPQPTGLEADALKYLAEQRDYGSGKNPNHFVTRWTRSLKLIQLVRQTWHNTRMTIPRNITAPAFEAAKSGNLADYLHELHEDPILWGRVQSGFATIGKLSQENPAFPILVALFPTTWFDQDQTYPLISLHQRVLDEARRHHLTTIDLLDDYSAAFSRFHEPLYCDILHPTQIGQRVAAAALLRQLETSGLIPPASIDTRRILDHPGVDRLTTFVLERLKIP